LTAFSLEDITRKLKDENIDFRTKVYLSNLKIKAYCKISDFLPESIVYYTAPDITEFALKNCTVILPFDATPKNTHVNYIFTEDPKVAFYAVAQLFSKSAIVEQGIHPTAQVSAKSSIAEHVSIGAYTVIYDNVIIGENTIIHPHCVIYPNTVIGEGTEIESHSIIGATGVFWTWDKHGRMWSLPQSGGVEIGRNCFIGTDVTIVRGSYSNDVTRVGNFTKIAHGTKIGHSTQIGSQCHLANNIAIGGAVELSDRCFIGSGATLKPGVKLAEGIIVGSGAVVVKSSDKKNAVLIGNPAKEKELVNKPSGMNEPLWMLQKKKNS
jgi:UDP-3-O-[3-hydroxymyristoyl] glucosamine N-acyltransferase